MDYNSLIASKGTSGAIATWSSYTLLDTATILEEAQALIFQSLRCREMRSTWNFALLNGYSYVDLPANFLDPIGRVHLTGAMIRVPHREQDFIEGRRMYDPTSGTLGTNPFTTTSGSRNVTVAFPSNSFSQGGIFRASGATAVGGLTLNGSFPIVTPGANSFVIDAGTAATSSAVGGGSAVEFACDDLIRSIPSGWAIWDERLQFDFAANDDYSATLSYYGRPALLSASNPTNFLTSRYPQIMRAACQAAAADFMRDDGEYQKCVTRLTALTAGAAAENDLELRGLELETETP